MNHTYFLIFLYVTSSLIAKAESQITKPALPNPEHISLGIDTTHSWKNSCLNASEQNEIDWKDPRELYTRQYPNDYFFFSLREVFKGKKLGTYRFFKRPDFTGSPDYILDLNGLHSNGDNICKWKDRYSEEAIAKNYLLNCHTNNLSNFLAFYDHNGNAWGSDFCVVIDISSYEKKDSNFLIKVKIAEKEYYLDNREMPDVQSGKILHLFKNRKAKAINLANAKAIKDFNNLKKINELKIFADLKKCIKSTSDECLQKHLNDESIRHRVNPYILGHSSSKSPA